MRVFRESWCFCNGGGKSERMKAAIFSGKGPAMAGISTAGISTAGMFSGTAFLIHRNLLLTTHLVLPSVAAAEAAEIRLQNCAAATLFPHRFFITSSVLDLTIVGLDCMDGESSTQTQQTHYLKTCSKPNLDLGSVVYLLGYTDKKDLTVGEGKVVIATDNLIKLSTDGVSWSPGSAGFDVHGNLAFMVCDPMKLATSPNTKSSSTSSSSSSSWKKDLPMQFGIPIPIICDWLNQHWEGNLDELNKPKLPIIRLMSAGQRSDHSCASFTMRCVFKPTEDANDEMILSPKVVWKPSDQPGPSFSAMESACEDNIQTADPPAATHLQGIPTPKNYDSPKFSSIPTRKKESNQVQLLDINFPTRISKTVLSPHSARNMLPTSEEKGFRESPSLQQLDEVRLDDGRSFPAEVAEVSSTGSVNGAGSEFQSSSSPVEMEEEMQYSSEGETTMYSAETAESRNIPSPRGGRIQQVRRSQSCVNYNRWGPTQRSTIARGAILEKHRSMMHSRRVYSQGAASQRSNDYFSPTVSSIMKKRGNAEQPSRPHRPTVVHSSSRWVV